MIFRRRGYPATSIVSLSDLPRLPNGPAPGAKAERWHEISERAFTEARAGAPAGLVAYYVTVEVEHVRKGHQGNAQSCGPCTEFADKFRRDFDAARRTRVESIGPVLNPPHPSWSVVSTSRVDIAPECSTGHPAIHADCDGCDCTCHGREETP